MKKGLILIPSQMFSGKTTDLIRLLKAEEHADRPFQAFKVPFDKRYGDGKIVTHDGMCIPSINVKNFEELFYNIKPETEVIGIDEKQFFDDESIEGVKDLSKKYLVIASLLQLDFRGCPFHYRTKEDFYKDSIYDVREILPYGRILSPQILPTCSHIENNRRCRQEAFYTQRWRKDGTLSQLSDSTIVIGGQESYAPRCEDHFITPQ